MCLSTVYMDSDENKQIVKDVARMEASEDGFLFTNLFGEETFVIGRVVSVDFVEGNAIVMNGG